MNNEKKNDVARHKSTFTKSGINDTSTFFKA